MLPRRLDLGGGTSGTLPFWRTTKSFQSSTPNLALPTVVPSCIVSSPYPPTPAADFPRITFLVYVHKILSIRGLVVIRESVFILSCRKEKPFPVLVPFAGGCLSSLNFPLHVRGFPSCALPGIINLQDLAGPPGSCEAFLSPAPLRAPSRWARQCFLFQANDVSKRGYRSVIRPCSIISLSCTQNSGEIPEK